MHFFTTSTIALLFIFLTFSHTSTFSYCIYFIVLLLSQYIVLCECRYMRQFTSSTAAHFFFLPTFLSYISSPGYPLFILRLLVLIYCALFVLGCYTRVSPSATASHGDVCVSRPSPLRLIRLGSEASETNHFWPVFVLSENLEIILLFFRQYISLEGVAFDERMQ